MTTRTFPSTDRRPATNGHTTHYSRAACPACHREGYQRRGTRYRVADHRTAGHTWHEQRTCQTCGHTYAVECLPYLAQALDQAHPVPVPVGPVQLEFAHVA